MKEFLASVYKEYYGFKDTFSRRRSIRNQDESGGISGTSDDIEIKWSNIATIIEEATEKHWEETKEKELTCWIQTLQLL